MKERKQITNTSMKENVTYDYDWMWKLFMTDQTIEQSMTRMRKIQNKENFQWHKRLNW